MSQTIAGNELSPTEAYNYYKTRQIPNGWYVHGRNDSQELSDDYVIQLTKDWDVAESYAHGGSKWLIKPKAEIDIIDFTSQDTGDMDELAKAAIEDYEKGMLPFARDIEASLGVDIGELTDTQINHEIRINYAPKDIVNTAGAYDNLDWVNYLYEKTNKGFVKTPDGAVALCKDDIIYIRVPKEREILKNELASEVKMQPQTYADLYTIQFKDTGELRSGNPWLHYYAVDKATGEFECEAYVEYLNKGEYSPYWGLETANEKKLIISNILGMTSQAFPYLLSKIEGYALAGEARESFMIVLNELQSKIASKLGYSGWRKLPSKLWSKRLRALDAEPTIQATHKSAADLHDRITKEVEEERKEIKGFPVSLSMDEYKEYWQPKGWKIIYIGPTSSWREEWGEWEAIREIVQNSLDEAESYESGTDDLGFFIKDKGRGIAVSSFLLGPTKLKEKWARGKYGEGMKIGALAMLRDGYPVYVESGNREVHLLFMEQEADTKVMSLAAIWRELSPPIQGTAWHIIGYNGPDFKDRFAVNLPKNAILVSNPSLLDEPVQRNNQIINVDFTKTARIYARDIYMRDLPGAYYSYNLWSFDLAPDRHAPKDESEMWRDMGRAWSGVTDLDMLKVFLQMGTDPPRMETPERFIDLSYMGYDKASGCDYKEHIIQNAKYWVKAWVTVFGEDAVLRTSDRWDSLVRHLGYKSIGLNYAARSTLEAVLPTDKKLIDKSQEMLRDVTVIKDTELTGTQLASLNLIRSIAEYYGGEDFGKRIYGAYIPPASDRVRTAGLYSTRLQEIYIAAEQLNHGKTAMDTFIHELAHHLSGAEDGEPAHYEKISYIAGQIIKLVSERRYDDRIVVSYFMW